VDKPAQSQAQPAELHFIGTRAAAGRRQTAHDENNLYRNLVDALPVAIYLTDADGRITYYNEAAAEMWGVRPELGKSEFCGSWKLFWPDGTSLPHDECPMALALKEQRPIRGVEAIAERPDGTRVPFQPFPTPLFDGAGRLAGAVNMLVDLTQQKRRDSLLTSIIDSSEDAIISKNIDGIIQSWNGGAERLFGYAAGEAIGKSVLMLIPPDRRDEETEIITRLRAGERVEHFETVRRRKDGSLIDISLTISPIRNAEGRIAGASKIARDISKKKQLEQAKAVLIEEIKHRVKNTLATIQAIATQTFREAPASERTAFEGRLKAVAEAYDLLTLKHWSRASVNDIVRRAVKPFRINSVERFIFDGEEIWLSANKAVLLTMALHELSTNAVKYGALSNGNGRILISWKKITDTNKFEIAWRESGGPAVREPERQGFGSTLIKGLMEREFGEAKLDFNSDGVRWSIRTALAPAQIADNG
jgi:two-component system CheB/CheR fusion protein